jgi:hypothetical protein
MEQLREYATGVFLAMLRDYRKVRSTSSKPNGSIAFKNNSTWALISRVIGSHRSPPTVT